MQYLLCTVIYIYDHTTVGGQVGQGRCTVTVDLYTTTSRGESIAGGRAVLGTHHCQAAASRQSFYSHINTYKMAEGADELPDSLLHAALDAYEQAEELELIHLDPPAFLAWIEKIRHT